jgi:hypothetical protein
VCINSTHISVFLHTRFFMHCWNTLEYGAGCTRVLQLLQVSFSYARGIVTCEFSKKFVLDKAASCPAGTLSCTMTSKWAGLGLWFRFVLQITFLAWTTRRRKRREDHGQHVVVEE